MVPTKDVELNEFCKQHIVTAPLNDIILPNKQCHSAITNHLKRFFFKISQKDLLQSIHYGQCNLLFSALPCPFSFPLSHICVYLPPSLLSCVCVCGAVPSGEYWLLYPMHEKINSSCWLQLLSQHQEHSNGVLVRRSGCTYKSL